MSALNLCFDILVFMSITVIPREYVCNTTHSPVDFLTPGSSMCFKHVNRKSVGFCGKMWVERA